MGRTLPTECEHGVTVDGGDFCRSERCPKCDAISTWHAEDARLAAAVVEAALTFAKECDEWIDSGYSCGAKVDHASDDLRLATNALLAHRATQQRQEGNREA